MTDFLTLINNRALWGVLVVLGVLLWWCVKTYFVPRTELQALLKAHADYIKEHKKEHELITSGCGKRYADMEKVHAQETKEVERRLAHLEKDREIFLQAIENLPTQAQMTKVLVALETQVGEDKAFHAQLVGIEGSIKSLHKRLDRVEEHLLNADK